MSKTRVDAHWIDLDSHASQVDAWYEKLGRDERSQARGFRLERERSRFVVRRGWVRELLSQRLTMSPTDIQISRNAFGKPSLPNCEIRFNLSYSAGMALCVIAEALELGCDLERIDRDLASVAIADHFFSAREKKCLLCLPREEWLEGFFNCWTRKEAYIKARGYGLFHPLDTFDVSLAPNDPAHLLRGCEGWSVRSFEPVPGFVAAVVAAGADWFLKLDNRMDSKGQGSANDTIIGAQVLAKAAQIDEPDDRSQQVIRRNMILNAEAVEQRLLHHRSLAHHQQISRQPSVESGPAPLFKGSFSTE